MANLKVKLGKLTLRNPIVCASGTFGFGEELKGLANFKNIGAVITKTITLKPRVGNPPPRIFEAEYGVINSVGLENPGLDAFINEKLPKIRNLGTKIIVSVGGFSSSEYKKVVAALDSKNEVDAFEINLSCPNLKLKKLISQDAAATYNLTKTLRKLTAKPLFIKITPEVTDIVKIAKAIKRAGADAVSLVNTFFSMVIDIESKKPYLGSIYGGYSGRAIKPLALYRVWKVAQDVKIPIIGGGGIETAQDAIEFMLAGASAVSVGTINLAYPNQSEGILKGIAQYLRRKKIDNVNKLKGGLIA